MSDSAVDPHGNYSILTRGNMILVDNSAKSSFLSFTPDWPAAKWAHTKHMDELYNMNRIAMAPLLPAAPPKPVFTLATATSLEQKGMLDSGTGKIKPTYPM